MGITDLPAAVATAVADTLAGVLGETSIKDDSANSSPATSEPKELAKSESELEDGEIRDSEDGDAEEDDGKVKTVFDDAKKFNVKHPLYSTWTLYYDAPQTGKVKAPPTPASHGFLEDMRQVVAFNSVEEFWGTYNNIVPPSQFPAKANYYLFKDGIQPAWEDDQNKNGGKWGIQVAREKSKGVIDKMWLYTMLAAIGETFETPLPSAPGEKAAPPVQSDLVTGVLIAARANFYRIAIWTREAPDTTLPETDALMARIMLIGRHFKVSVLGFGLGESVGGGQAGSLTSEVNFESHTDSEVRGNKKKIVI